MCRSNFSPLIICHNPKIAVKTLLYPGRLRFEFLGTNNLDILKLSFLVPTHPSIINHYAGCLLCYYSPKCKCIRRSSASSIRSTKMKAAAFSRALIVTGTVLKFFIDAKKSEVRSNAYGQWHSLPVIVSESSNVHLDKLPRP